MAEARAERGSRPISSHSVGLRVVGEVALRMRPGGPLRSPSTSPSRAGRPRRASTPASQRPGEARAEALRPSGPAARGSDRPRPRARSAPEVSRAARARFASWRRPTAASSASASDWTPTETRLMPARRQASAASAETSSGFASSVDLGALGDREARRAGPRAGARSPPAAAATAFRRRGRPSRSAAPPPRSRAAPPRARAAAEIALAARRRPSSRRTRSSRSARRSTAGGRRGRRRRSPRGAPGAPPPRPRPRLAAEGKHPPEVSLPRDRREVAARLVDPAHGRRRAAPRGARAAPRAPRAPRGGEAAAALPGRLPRPGGPRRQQPEPGLPPAQRRGAVRSAARAARQPLAMVDRRRRSRRPAAGSAARRAPRRSLGAPRRRAPGARPRATRLAPGFAASASASTASSRRSSPGKQRKEAPQARPASRAARSAGKAVDGAGRGRADVDKTTAARRGLREAFRSRVEEIDGAAGSSARLRSRAVRAAHAPRRGAGPDQHRARRQPRDRRAPRLRIGTGPPRRSASRRAGNEPPLDRDRTETPPHPLDAVRHEPARQTPAAGDELLAGAHERMRRRTRRRSSAPARGGRTRARCAPAPAVPREHVGLEIDGVARLRPGPRVVRRCVSGITATSNDAPAAGRRPSGSRRRARPSPSSRRTGRARAGSRT